MDANVARIVERVIRADDRRSAAEAPGAGRPFDPSKPVSPSNTSIANSKMETDSTFSVHPPFPTLKESPSEIATNKFGKAPSSVSHMGPNYQRLHAQDRIRILDLTQNRIQAAKKIAPVPPSVSLKKFDDKALRKNGVVAISAQSLPEMAVHNTSLYNLEPAISEPVLIENPDSRTLRMLGISCSPNESIVLASSPRCSLAQLFSIDVAFSKSSGLHESLSWSGNTDVPFSFVCWGEVKLIKTFYDQLMRVSTSRGPWFVSKPSNLLLRRLHVSGPAILGIANCSPFSLAPVLDRFWKAHIDASIEAINCCDGVIVIGSDEDLKDLQGQLSSSK